MAAQPERKRRFEHLGSGPFHAELDEAAWGAASLQAERWSCGVRVRSDRPPGYVTFALIEAAAFLKLLLYVSVIACVFVPWGIAVSGQGLSAYIAAFALYAAKLAAAGFTLAVFETVIAKMRVFRVSDFLGAALMLGFLAALLLFVSRVT